MATCNSVYWLYLGDGGLYIPYDPAASEQIDTEYARGNSNYAIPGTEYRIDFRTMTQIRTTTGNTRPVQRVPILIPSTKIMAIWEWEDSPRKFVPYGIQASLDIETAYKNKLRAVDLSVTTAHIPYTIDMVAMQQTRHSFGTRRRIQRVSLPRPLHTFLKDHTGLGHTSSSGSSATTPTYGSSGSVIASVSGIGSHTSVGSASFISPATAMIKSGSCSQSKKDAKTKITGKKAPKTAAAVVISPLKSPKIKGRPKKAANKPKKIDKEDEMFGQYVKRVTALNFGEDGPCPICMSELSELSGFEDGTELPTPVSSTPPSPDLCKLKRCGHMLHRACLVMYMKNNAKSGLTCPTCKTIHGVKTGDMPNGSMTHRIQPYSLPGHSGYNTIEITYNFAPGQHNGKHYYTNGFPRTCYVPCSPKGQKVFKLLQVAWKRRLTFTIGTSVTTGSTDTIVWNEIHHKTEARGNSTGHGYPDDNYLDNVLAEMAAQGVEDVDGTEDYGTESSEEDL